MVEGYHSPRARKKKTRQQEREELRKQREENRKREKTTLRPEESRYVKEMLKPDVDPGEAARRAGISSIPTRPIVKSTILALRERQLEAADITLPWVIQRLGWVADFDPAKMHDEEDNLLPINKMDRATRAGISGFDVERRTEWHGSGEEREEEIYYVLKPRTRDSVRALELLMRYLTNGGGIRGKDRLHELLGAYKFGPVKKLKK